ncbi:hypothetical protein I552_5353 [Mycobacterium xenopi 3993]|nr:hypothetical protein I552_5353 [Mycobacterium xenopi 3993]
MQRHWYKARKAAGRDDLRWHDLRHSGLCWPRPLARAWPS